MKSDIKIVANAEELSRMAKEEFVREARNVVRARGVCTVALSGGSTPRGLYRSLAGEREGSFRPRLSWDRIHFFWGDERHVPPEHPDSNYRMAHEALLSRVAIPPDNVHRIKTEYSDAGKAADEYDRTLREFFRLAAGQFPRFDLALLGMGSDGHTASLFPGTGAVHEQEHLVVANWVEQFHGYRVTLTPPVLNNAAYILFLVSGEDKAEVLQAVLQGAYRPDRFPAQIVRPTHGRLLWLVDQAAASLLHPGG
jgi:6-phosphogluconolactonase